MSGIREILLYQKSPVLFQGKISEWELLKWSKEDWSRLFENKSLPFRCGLKKCSPVPQWERTCKTLYMTLDDFFKSDGEDDSDSWKYFDYKYVSQWLCNSEAFKTLSWANFGFPEITPNDCTLWIGSSGAHTPCHMDTYGCNLVAQIYGHKQWILFPPSESSNLKMSRVPYEESSIYSALNFSGPLGNICNALDNAYIVTLAPGDVLFVPNHWWHYVENLDTAITINTWIPLPNDEESRMSEVLVRFLVSQTISNLPSEQASKVLNPNEDDLKETSLETTMSQIKLCVGNCMEALKSAQENVVKVNTCIKGPYELPQIEGKRDETSHSPDAKRQRVDKMGQIDRFGSSTFENNEDFKVLSKCNSVELRNILDAKCNCGSKEKHEDGMRSHPAPDDAIKLLPAVINAFSHPEVIEMVTKHLVKGMISEET